MNSILMALMLWIAANTPYETADVALPEVVEMTPEELTREFYTDALHLLPDDGVDERVRALYAPGDGEIGRIYILSALHVEGADDMDGPYANPYFREILLHELVHHVQHRTGMMDGFLCPAQGELDAYLFGGMYLAQTGVTDPMPNRRFWAAMYGRC